MGVIGLAPESWERVADRIERADGPIAWSWAAAPRQDSTWQVVLLTVRGACRSMEVVHRYPKVILGCAELTPAEAAERFRSGQVHDDPRKDSEAFAIEPPSSASFPMWITTEPEYGYYLAPSGDWPAFYWTQSLSTPGEPYPSMVDPLYGKGLPYFPSLQVALATLAYGLPPSHVNTNFNPQALVRLPDLRAKVAIAATDDGTIHISVTEGKAGGSNATVIHAVWRRGSADIVWERRDERIARPSTFTIDTQGIPADFWVLLTDEEGVALDRAGWSSETGVQPGLSGPLTARVQRWCVEGEHYQLEYKEKLVEDRTKRRFAETVTAFANGAGGVILVGVTNDGDVVGFDPPALRDMIVDIIRTRVDDPVEPDIERVEMSGKAVWVVTINPQPAEAKPFRCGGRVIVRAAGSNRLATTGEIRQLSAPIAQRSGFRSGGMGLTFQRLLVAGDP